MKKCIFYLLLSFLLLHCNKEANGPSEDDFKLKTLVIGDSAGGVYHTYNFSYDANNELVKMVRDDMDSVQIIHLNDQVLKLIFDFNASEGISFDAYAYINSSGYIETINASYPVRDALGYYDFRFKNTNEIDSIFEPEKTLAIGMGTYTEYFTDFNIIWDGSNYMHSKTFIKRIYLLPVPSDTITSSYEYYYTSHKNTGCIPLQRIYGWEPNSSWFLDREIDPIFILNVDGYYAYKPNANLIDKIVKNSRFASNSEIKMNYVFNDKNLVTEVHVGQTRYILSYNE